MTVIWRPTETGTLARQSIPLSAPILRLAFAPAVLDVVRTRAAFDALEDEWNALFERAGRDTQVFQTFNWNWHWANHYLPADEHTSPSPQLAIVTARRNGRLVMVWPLVQERVAGLRELRWMGEPVSQYGDVLIDTLADADGLLNRAWELIATQLRPDVIHLRKVRADAVVAPLLRAAGALQVASAAAPYLDLASAPDFATYEQRYSAKARKNRRRLMRRLEELGPMSIERHAQGPAAAAAAREGIALKRAWVRDTGRLSRAVSDDRFTAFFADVADGKGRPAGCQVMALKSSGSTAGVAIDVTSGGRRAAHVIVHDPKLDHVSAGTLLLQEWIRTASGDGIATFDLLAPAYDYKSDWADGSIPVGDHAIGLTLAGRLYVRVFLGIVRQKLKAVAEASSPWLKLIATHAWLPAVPRTRRILHQLTPSFF